VNPILLAMFHSPVLLSGLQRMALILPLCLSICVVYKTIRCDRLHDVPLASLVLWVTMLAGMYAVGVVVWLVNMLLA